VFEKASRESFQALAEKIQDKKKKHRRPAKGPGKKPLKGLICSKKKKVGSPLGRRGRGKMGFT